MRQVLYVFLPVFLSMQYLSETGPVCVSACVFTMQCLSETGSVYVSACVSFSAVSQ